MAKKFYSIGLRKKVLMGLWKLDLFAILILAGKTSNKVFNFKLGRFDAGQCDNVTF